MRVRLVQESSGFGFNQRIIPWMTESEENLHLLEKLQTGVACELPENIAKNIWNLVDIETGKIVSLRSSFEISIEEVSKRYIDKRKSDTSQIREAAKAILNPNTISKEKE